MNRALTIYLILLVGLVSCKNTEERFNKLEIAKKYYEALDKSNSSEMKTLLADSFFTVIPKYDYKVAYSQNDYIDKWLKWDSIFEPNYEVLNIELENGIVKAKISKIDKRIFFLMQEPFITNEILRFNNNKIIVVETEYVNFNENTWETNKNNLLKWIHENHPELNGFIYEQTKAGGEKFLKAIELYKAEN